MHKFDQDADETLGWLEEKEALQVAMESENLDRADIPTLKQLMLKHDEFVHGVLAVEKQVRIFVLFLPVLSHFFKFFAN